VGPRAFLNDYGRAGAQEVVRWRCAPSDVTLQQGLGVVVHDIQALPQRMDENLFMLAFEALLDARPCGR
jgi:hypothetical protein